MKGAFVMNKLLMTACLALGLSACGGTEFEQDTDTLASTRQDIINVECPAGSTYSQTIWTCGAPTTLCPNGRNEQHVICRDSSGSYIDAGANGRTNGCCLVAE
jgi:hypothetical protein